VLHRYDRGGLGGIQYPLISFYVCIQLENTEIVRVDEVETFASKGFPGLGFDRALQGW